MTLSNKVTNKQILNNFHTKEQACVTIHGDKYDYSKFVFINTTTKGTIVCREHGDFQQSLHVHLKGTGCPKCGIATAHSLTIKSTTMFIEEAITKHGDTYDYSKVDYKGTKSKVLLSCKVHGDFTQTAQVHLRGHGCPVCAKQFNFQNYHDKPTILYFFKIKNVWKIGITVKELYKRYSQDYSYITEVKTWEFPQGKEAYEYEQGIISMFNKYKYNGPSPFTDGTGITECFSVDIYKIWEKENVS